MCAVLLKLAFAEIYSTSPSVYANFHSILATDACGVRGSLQSIPTAMLAFAPGELSTIARPLPVPCCPKWAQSADIFSQAFQLCRHVLSSTKRDGKVIWDNAWCGF